MAIVSSSKPRNTRQVVGPSNLPGATGKPSCWNTPIVASVSGIYSFDSSVPTNSQSILKESSLAIPEAPERVPHPKMIPQIKNEKMLQVLKLCKKCYVCDDI